MNSMAANAPIETRESSVASRPGSGVWIVMAAFNEQRRIGTVLQTLCSEGHSVVVVDDCSRDDTALVALSFPVWVVRHPVNCGQGAALQTGIDFALGRGAEIVVTFDADGQHAADEIPRLISPVREGQCDVSLGSRFLGQAVNIPWTRWSLLKLAVLFTRLTSRISVTDAHNGFRAFSRHAASAIRITQPRMAHASEILDEVGRLGLSYTEVPVTITYDETTLAKGQSSWGALKIAGHLLVGKYLK